MGDGVGGGVLRRDDDTRAGKGRSRRWNPGLGAAAAAESTRAGKTLPVRDANKALASLFVCLLVLRSFFCAVSSSGPVWEGRGRVRVRRVLSDSAGKGAPWGPLGPGSVARLSNRGWPQGPTVSLHLLQKPHLHTGVPWWGGLGLWTGIPGRFMDPAMDKSGRGA